VHLRTAGLLGLICCALGATPASTQDSTLFKVLKLDGNQVRWHMPRNGGRLVTWRLAAEPSEFPGARNCRKMTALDGLIATSELEAATVRREISAAFAMWEAVADITFQEAPEDTRADILIGAQIDPEGWAFADVFYDAASPEPIKPISRALVCLNPLKSWKVSFDGDLKTYDLRYTLAHEIGHAIGLDHPNGGGQIMGYRYEERFRALQPGDVRGAILLYGEPREAGVAVAAATERTYARPASPARSFAKRWGTRAFTARSP
jgi:hypothetical protein